jgi:mono/diheme cytochrome c family protein
MVAGERTSYDRCVSSPPRLIRLVVLPALLFLVFAGTAFALAKWHPASPSAASATGTVSAAAGNATAGAAAFQQSCAGCHGAGGSGGAGPKLAGAAITLAAAKAQIDNGGGIMPAGLVKGSTEDDVIAYLATILAKPAR